MVKRPSPISEEWICEECEEENRQATQVPSKSMPFNKTKESAKVKFISAEEVASLASGSKTSISSPKGNWIPGTSNVCKRPSVTSKITSRPIATTELQGSLGKKSSLTPVPPGFESSKVDDEASCAPSKSYSKCLVKIKTEDEPATLQPISIKSQLAGSDSRCNLLLSSPHMSGEHLKAPDKALASCKEEKIEPCSYVDVHPFPLKPTKDAKQKYITESDVEDSGLCTDVPYMESDIQRICLSSALRMIPNENEIQWRGRFVIRDRGDHIYEDIRAHFPGKVSVKAYNASKALPEKLQCSLIRRVDIWPQIFQLDPPSRDDVAMYFLPSEFDRVKEKYVRLLERMNKHDLAICCYLDDLELLIYTSNLLKLDRQELNTNVYLWGIFHRTRKKELNQVTVVPGEVNYVEAEMEIDMIGGSDVGRVDKPVIKPPVMPRGQLNDCVSAFDQQGLNINKSSTVLLKLKNHEEQNIPTSPPGLSKPSKGDSDCQKRPFVNFAVKKPISHIISDVPPGFSRTCNLKQGNESSESSGKSSIPQKHDKWHSTSSISRGKSVISCSRTEKGNPRCRQSSTLSLLPEESLARVCPVEPRNEGQNLDGGISRSVPSVSPDLSLSRSPQYICDGKWQIPAASRERLKKDGHGKKETW